MGSKERGSVMIEFCICFGFILVLVLHVFSLARVLQEKVVLVQAAKASVREAALCSNCTAQLRGRLMTRSIIARLQAAGYEPANYMFESRLEDVPLGDSFLSLLRVRILDTEGASALYSSFAPWTVSGSAEAPLGPTQEIIPMQVRLNADSFNGGTSQQ